MLASNGNGIDFLGSLHFMSFMYILYTVQLYTVRDKYLSIFVNFTDCYSFFHVILAHFMSMKIKLAQKMQATYRRLRSRRRWKWQWNGSEAKRNEMKWCQNTIVWCVKKLIKIVFHNVRDTALKVGSVPISCSSAKLLCFFFCWAKQFHWFRFLVASQRLVMMFLIQNWLVNNWNRHVQFPSHEFDIILMEFSHRTSFTQKIYAQSNQTHN